MKVNFTKGPWVTEGFLIRSRYDGSVVCRIIPWDSSGCRQEDHINTKVIAAVPDLVDALEDLLASNGPGTKACGHDLTCICAEDKAKAALAKTYGETKNQEPTP